MPTLSLRIDLDPQGRIGPGKVALLEAIDASGSISAAARDMGMSYKRAWDLVEEMKALFGQPVVGTRTGGQKGGGAGLTPLGHSVVRHFRSMEKAALDAAAPHMAALQADLDAGQ
jgi:molybdate transport system regulatory protein